MTKPFYKIEVPSSVGDKALAYAKSITDWVPSHGFFIQRLPMDILSEDSFLLRTIRDFGGTPILIKIEPFNWYGFHIDENRSCAINLMLEGHSYTVFGGDITANNVSFTPMDYEPNHYYMLDTQKKHAVFNLEQTRYAISIGFNKPIEFETIVDACIANGLVKEK